MFRLLPYKVASQRVSHSLDKDPLSTEEKFLEGENDDADGGSMELVGVVPFTSPGSCKTKACVIENDRSDTPRAAFRNIFQGVDGRSLPSNLRVDCSPVDEIMFGPMYSARNFVNTVSDSRNLARRGA